MSVAQPRTRRSYSLGKSESKMVQFWVSAEFRALLDCVSMRTGQSKSGYIRKAIWQQLKRDAEAAELAQYKRDQWGATK